MFHAKDGLYFERVGQDDVKVVVEDLYKTKREIVLSADTWASVVATVSLRGEDYETWREALTMHNKPKSQ